jgi:hypothetical protein
MPIDEQILWTLIILFLAFVGASVLVFIPIVLGFLIGFFMSLFK